MLAPPRGPPHRSLLLKVHDFADSAASALPSNDSMHIEPWLATGQLTPKSAGRQYSLSPGSAGPESPYSHNVANPHIAVTDAIGDSFHAFPSTDDLQHYQIAKSFPSSHDASFYANYPNYTMATVGAAKPRFGSKSRPLSVASSITSDSPATPAGEPDESRRRKTAFSAVPKLDRTMTDVYGDELYSPNFTVASSSSSQVPISPNNDLFSQRLQAANSQHLNIGQSPMSVDSRDRSPFRNGSPLAPMPHVDFPTSLGGSHMGYNNSPRHMHEQNRVVHDVQATQGHSERTHDISTPQTISPKDAILDYHEHEGEDNFPLFPPQDSAHFEDNHLSKAVAQSQHSFNTMPFDGNAFADLVASQLPTGLHVPQQYPFVADSRHQHQRLGAALGSRSATLPSRMDSSDLGGSDSSHAASPTRPAATNADGGTYTCTYHGCTLRFDTPALLQKHKREGHRQAHGTSSGRRSEISSTGMTSTLLNTQAGPHRCDRINPSTGKPCNTIFSRPYDLTRHEDTIHNARKQKVRCELCTDDKTFSRADALTRHFRVCHPDLEIPGKSRRRGGHGHS